MWLYIYLSIAVLTFIVVRNFFKNADEWTNKLMIVFFFVSLIPAVNIIMLLVVIGMEIDETGWFDEDGL